MARQVTLEDGTVLNLDRYAQLTGDTVQIVIEAASDPDGVNGTWVLCPDFVGPGFTANFERSEWYPPEPVVVPPKPYLHFIDKGPFNDRFGAKKLAVLMSADPIIQAFNSDKSDREYIDLERADVRAAVGYMVGIPLTLGADTFTIAAPILTQPELEHILNLTVADMEQVALVKKFFS
jgi:hypothetical protein